MRKSKLILLSLCLLPLSSLACGDTFYLDLKLGKRINGRDHFQERKGDPGRSDKLFFGGFGYQWETFYLELSHQSDPGEHDVGQEAFWIGARIVP